MGAFLDRAATRAVLERRHLLLALVALYWFPTSVTDRAGDWRYFADGARLLFGDSGVHLYAEHPELHMGPLSLVVALLGQHAVHVLMWVLGVGTIFTVERAAIAARGDSALLRIGTLLGGGVFLVTWFTAAGPISHVDDVLAMFGAAVAVWGVATRRPWVVGLAIGLAVAAKPWAIVLVPLAFAVPARIRVLVVAVGVGAAFWLPFVLGDPATLSSMDFAQLNDQASALRVLGVDGATPSWVRPAQVLLGIAVGLLAVRRGRWAAAVVGAVGVRFALDPAVYEYYTPTLVLGALVWDLVGSRIQLPVLTLLTFVALQDAPQVIADPSTLGVIRLTAAAACVVVAVAPWPRRSPATMREPLPT